MRLVLDRCTLEKMYMSFIRPILEYGDVVWDNDLQILINKIDGVQVEAMRIVTGLINIAGQAISRNQLRKNSPIG